MMLNHPSDTQGPRRLVPLAVATLLWFVWFVALSTAVSTPHVTHLRWFSPLGSAFMAGDDSDDIIYKWIPLSKISPLLQQAVVLAEDDQFFEHNGVDVEAVKKAAEVNWKRKRFSRGASTISMQLARNLYLSPHKSIFRKLKEVLIALKLDRELPKERILEIYLNVAEWGEGIYGAEAAAEHYFGVKARDLSRHQAAFLAAILPRPRFYDKHRGGPHLQGRVSLIEGRL